jgi:hypothetical protein
MPRHGCFASAVSRRPHRTHEEATVGYRLRPGKPIAQEVVRIADRQLALALAGLRIAADSENNSAVHATRRHIKKIRALMKLVRRALGRRHYGAANRHLRAVNRLLAPVADGQAVLETLARVAARYRDELPRDVVADVHHSLVRRDTMAREQAAVNDVARTAARLLRRERDRVRHWELSERGFGAVAEGYERTVTAGRRAMVKAANGQGDEYHTWRQRVKEHWLQIRLLQERCGNRLGADERRLEELDGLLGECHNCVILRDAVRSDSTLTRTDAARCLRVVRRYEHTLRRAAHQLGAKVYQDTPAQDAARVHRLWRSARRATPVPGRGTSWRSAA